MSTLLFVSGSLRAGSVNTAVVRAARRIAETDPRVRRTAVLRLPDFPLYNEDIERSGAPRAVRAARASVRAADSPPAGLPVRAGARFMLEAVGMSWLRRWMMWAAVAFRTTRSVMA
jgi:chromate reductase